MFKITIILLCGVSLLVSGDADTVVSGNGNKAAEIAVDSVPPGSVDVSNTTTPPQPPTPTTTTPKPTDPTTTTTTTTTPTTPTTTTTTTPKPTPPPTPKPTPPPTPKPPTTTSTVAPSTTTAKPPAPLPEPTPGKWEVDDKKQVCLIAQMAIQVHLEFVKDNVTMKTAFNVPVDNKTVTVSGSCGSWEQNLTLTWPCDKNITSQGNDSLTLHFVKNDTQKHYSLHHLEIVLAPSHFNSSTPLTLMHNAQQFSTGLSNSYRCFKSQKMDLTLDTKPNNTVGYLKVSDLQFQAFRTDNNTVFGLAEDCADTPDIVPIVVGCALAALVVIVLIAYLVGRRRRNAQGYSSM